MTLKPTTLVAYRTKSGQRRHAVVLHGVPGQPDAVVLRVGKRGVIAKLNGKELVEAGR